jgi:hypothetical protein
MQTQIMESADRGWWAKQIPNIVNTNFHDRCFPAENQDLHTPLVEELLLESS